MVVVSLGCVRSSLSLFLSLDLELPSCVSWGLRDSNLWMGLWLAYLFVGGSLRGLDGLGWVGGVWCMVYGVCRK